MAMQPEGIEGEQRIHHLLNENGLKHFQPDCISEKSLIDRTSGWYIYEVKQQEKYIAPPYDGHGLPVWQVEARLNFYKKTGIRCIFLIYEKNATDIYYQYLDVLEEGKYHDTLGDKPRRIYKLGNFIHTIDKEKERMINLRKSYNEFKKDE